MQALYRLLKKYTLEDALNLEKQDLQYIAIEKLCSNVQNKELFFGLILTNSIICYQLSSTGEKYWEEFSTESTMFFVEQKEKIQGRFPISPSLKLLSTDSSE